MAQLAKTSYPFERKSERYSLEGMKEEEAEMARLDRESAKLADGVVAGCVVSFPVGDGMANYLVKSEKPLVLQHIDFFDGYGLPAAHMRGIRLEEVRRIVRGQKGLKAIFSARSASEV